VNWPWGETAPAKFIINNKRTAPSQRWRDAAAADTYSKTSAQWSVVEALPSGHAVVLQPASLDAHGMKIHHAPSLEYDFTTQGAKSRLRGFLPTFRIVPE